MEERAIRRSRRPCSLPGRSSWFARFARGPEGPAPALDQMFTDARSADCPRDDPPSYYPNAVEAEQSNDPKKERPMKLIRAMFLLLAVCLPTSWTLAHAEDAAGAG